MRGMATCRFRDNEPVPSYGTPLFATDDPEVVTANPGGPFIGTMARNDPIVVGRTVEVAAATPVVSTIGPARPFLPPTFHYICSACSAPIDEPTTCVYCKRRRGIHRRLEHGPGLATLPEPVEELPPGCAWSTATWDEP